LGSKKPDSITFVWMQGEKDARERLGEFYSASFRGVVDQLKSDLGRKDINFVIGRLSDFDNENKRYPHWTRVREEQVKLAEGDAVGEWVDTDDLNGKGNGLHYDKEGYRVLGERFAEKAIKLVNEPKEK
ncbi:MAG: lysophospholipase L1-like esterase, partial [Verrucomicrobiales bacterium]